MAITAYTALASDPSVKEADLSSLTETTSPSPAGPFGRRAPVGPVSGALSAGVPVFGTAARILNEQGNELPPGEAGEIATRGPMVVPGYWNRPDATARTLPGGELRTGDIEFMDCDGWFYLVDRSNDMIVARPLPGRDGVGLRQPPARCQREPEVLPELPKTPTGKLLRRELRQRAADGPPA